MAATELGAELTVDLRAAALLSKLYEVGEEVGSGMSGAVFRAVRRCDRYVVAVKQMRDTPDDPTLTLAARNEVAVLRALWEGDSEPHPAIIRFIDHHYTQLLVLEYFAAGRTLFTAISQCEPPVPWCSVARQLLGALAFLHDGPGSDSGYTHCDLKLENVLIDAATHEIRLVDFGAARSAAYTPHADCTWGGTVTYHAPELLPPPSYTTRSTALARQHKHIWRTHPLAFFKRTDVFAAGLVLYEVATRCAFFDEASHMAEMGPYTDAQLRRLHALHDTYEWPERVAFHNSVFAADEAGPRMRATITACCTPNPAGRASAATALALLAAPLK